ncbi:MAG: PD-(D/E)XK nuclease family protein [Bacteroidota bacterium]
MYASHTKLECAEACLYRYKKCYIDKTPERPSWPLLIGRATHAAIAAYTRHCIDTSSATDLGAVPAIARQACFEGDDAPGALAIPEVIEILQTFAGSHIIAADSLIGIEERIPNSWRPPDSWPDGPNLDKHVFVGIIDRLDGEDFAAIITDYKTDWQVRSQADVERDVQLRRYAWLVHSEYPYFQTFRVRLDFVRHGIVREVELGLDEVQQTEEELIAAVDRLAGMKAFPATPGEGCAICGFASECPALKGDEIRACATPEDAGKVAARLIVLEKRADELKQMLKDYCAQAGPVSVNGVQWGHIKTTSQGIEDVKTFAERLQAAKLDPWSYLAADGRKLKSLLRKPDLAGALADLLVDKSYTTFRSKRAADEEVESA